jgi:hypothetical protein
VCDDVANPYQIVVAFIATLRELYEDVIPHLDLTTCVHLLKVLLFAPTQ